MAPIEDRSIDLNRYILMYEDERVVDALALFQVEPDAQDWWYLVVVLDSGDYAVARFSDLLEPINVGRTAFLERPLSELVGIVLTRASMVEQDATSLDEAQEQAFRAKETLGSPAAVVIRGGEFRGILALGTRGVAPGGLFQSQLIELAGKYAQIPDKGVVVRRRLERKGKQSRAASTSAPATSTSPSEVKTDG